MPPYDDITQTGPQNWRDLKEQNESQFLDKDTRKKWLKYLKSTAKGLEFLKGKNSNFMDDGTFASVSLENAFQDAYFYDAFKGTKEINDLVQLPRGQRIAFYNRYKGSSAIFNARENQKGETGILTPDINIPYINNEVSGILSRSGEIVENKQKAKERVDNITDIEPIYTNDEFEALYNKLDKEADELYKPKLKIHFDLSTGGMAKGVEEKIEYDNYIKNKNQYIIDNIKIPQKDNPFREVSYEQFVENLSKISNVYNKLDGSKWLNLSDEDKFNLYLKYRDDLMLGKLPKVQSEIDKELGNVVEKNQPGWLEGGGDELVHSKRQVFFEQAAAGAVENLMDALLVPAGLIYGLGSSILGNNFWEESSYLPSLAHDVSKAITGENSTAYGDSWSSALANSGYTIGTMAIDAALMALPVLGRGRYIGKATEEAAKIAKTAKFDKFNKIYGNSMAINFGLCEGAIDAIDVRNEIIQNAEKNAQSLPVDQREGYMQNAINEANAAYGRTLIEESLVVNTGTLLGLGFLGSIAPTKLVSFKAPKWQKMITTKNLGKTTAFLGHTAEGVLRTTAGELLEEYAQGMSSGINKARAEYNIDKYAEALHYGLGSEYLNAAHLGFMQGLERFAPEAWREMDPENLTKQVILSTLLFRGLKAPGFGGKTKGQIQIDNNNAIGKLWDGIAKWSPVRTGIGQIISDAKGVTYDIDNRLKAGFTSLINDPKIIETMQDQSALTDIGIQMQKALNGNNISEYQKQAAAYQAAQGIMLANAVANNTRFGKNYVQVLEKRANFDNLSEEEQKEVYNNYIKELQIGMIKDIPQEEQIKLMQNTAQQSLDIMNEAVSVINRLKKDSNLDGTDIRPLVFAELLYAHTPDTIKENWDNVIEVVNNHEWNTTDEQLKEKGINPEAYHYLVDNYFKQGDLKQRDLAFTEAVVKGFSRKDISDARTEIVNELLKEDANIVSYVNNDKSLRSWRKSVAMQWNNMYDRVLKGENIFDEDGFLKKISDKVDSIVSSPKRNRKRFIKDINKSESVQDIYGVYTTARNDENINFDIDEAIDSIQDSNKRNKIKAVKDIIRSSNSLKVAITRQGFGDNLQEKLFEQVDMNASIANSVNDLYDISKYSFEGVSPDLVDKMSGKLQEAINIAKNNYQNAQTVDTAPTQKQENKEKETPKENLTDDSINTVPPVNDKPIEKFSIDEAQKIAKEISDLMQSENYDIDIVKQKIEELKQRCPDKYNVVVGGTMVILQRVETHEIISESDDEDLNYDVESSVPEEIVEPIEEEQKNIQEEQTQEPVKYPDNDIRSVTKVAIGKFNQEGHYYTFPIRDEVVDDNTRVQASYTDKQGNINTNISSPLEILSVDEYNKKSEENSSEFMSLQDIISNYPRPTFVNKDNQEVPKKQSESVKASKNNHTKIQQERLNNNITPARNEIDREQLDDKDGTKMQRLANPNYKNIDQKLEDNGAFEYRNSAALQIGDKISFVVTQEEMPDGSTGTVIWEVTDNKEKQLQEDNGFQGKQVLSVLDQTNAEGKRAELIQKIREAYDNAGKPESFLYDKEQFEVTGIIDGIIPFQRTNPTEAQQDSTIQANNMKKSFTKVNGKYGTKFWSEKKKKFVHVPVILRQVLKSHNGNSIITTRNIDQVSIVKHELASQNPTREVMLVVPTPTGYKATHSVYILVRSIDGAIEKYKEAINNGALGKFFINRIARRVNSVDGGKTNFTDILSFSMNCSEEVRFDKNHNRLDLGYTKEGLSTPLLHVVKKADKWIITEDDARIVLDDNNGKGFSFEDICKEYLNRLIDSEDANVSLRLDINAIKKNEEENKSNYNKDNDILNTLIDGGFLWTPNSIGNRVTMENTGFVASLNDEYKEKTVKIEKEPANIPEAAPIENNIKPESIKPKIAKREPENISTRTGSNARVKRVKLRASDTQKADVKPTVQNVSQEGQNTLNNTIDNIASKSFDSLSEKDQKDILNKVSKEEWNGLSKEERINVLNCIG